MAVSNFFYPTTKAPSLGRLDGRPLGSWDNPYAWSEQKSAFMASSSKSNGGQVAPLFHKTNQQGDYDIYLQSFFIGPLNAQTVSGVYSHCMAIMAQWLQPAPDSPTADAIVAYKVHAYITQGHSTAVRHVLIDNYVDTGFFPGPFDGLGAGIWLTWDTAPTMVTGAALSGDYVRIEIGARVVSSPTPTPNYYPTETWTSDLQFRHFYGTTDGSNSPYPDATPNTNYDFSSGWFQFADGLDIDTTAVAAPANDDCADAVVISTFPYTSPRIDTTQSADTGKAVWYKFTAPTDGRIFFSTYGSTFLSEIDIYEGDCAGLFPSTYVKSSGLADQRGLSVAVVTVVQGTDYWVRVRNLTSSRNAINAGGSLVVNASYRSAPQEDDLYLPCGHVVAVRDGVVVNVNPLFSGDAPSGVVIDYSGIAMNRLDSGVDVGERLLVGIHNIDTVEILAIGDLDWGDGQTEIDFMFDPWNAEAPLITRHPSTLAIDRANNHLYVAFFGNGYLFIDGYGLNTSDRPAVLNTVSNVDAYRAIRRLGVAEGDSQSGAPYTDVLHLATPEVTAPWAISIDEDNGLIYFTSGSYYVPVGGQQIRVYSIGAGITSTFATLALQSGNVPGLRGLQHIPGGGLLVCNSTVVQRLNASGTVVDTYTPSDALNSQTLTDVKLTVDGTQFWAVDSASTKIYLVDLETMLEVASYDTWLLPGTLAQMAIYQPSGITPPIPPSEGFAVATEECPDTLLTDAPGKPLPKFLQVHGYLRQAQPTTNAPVTLGSAPRASLRDRFKG